MANEKKPISSARLDEFFEVMPRFVPTFRNRMLHWVRSADHVTGKVASGTAVYAEAAMFVVRVAGMLTDLRDRFSGAGATPDQIVAGGFAARHREDLRDKVKMAIENLYSQFSEDELLWLELRRHEQSHPFLDGYRPKAADGPRWDKWESKILNRRVLPLDEVYGRCANVEKQHGEFTATCVALARKSFQHVGAVQLAVVPLMAGV